MIIAKKKREIMNDSLSTYLEKKAESMAQKTFSKLIANLKNVFEMKKENLITDEEYVVLRKKIVMGKEVQ